MPMPAFRRTAVVVLMALLAGLLGVTPASAHQRFTVLVFSKVTNFHHDSIPAGVAAIKDLGVENHFGVEVSDDAAVFTDANLARYDAIVFNNTNSTPEAGDLLNAGQRAAFQRYIRAGGGFTG